MTALSDGTAEILARTLEPSDKQFTAKCKVSVTGSIEPAEPIPFGEIIAAGKLSAKVCFILTAVTLS